MLRNRNAGALGPARQSGSVIILAALGISLTVILLSITNIGFLYFYKREYQKTADLAAMAGARQLISQNGSVSCTNNATPAAQASAARNMGSKPYQLVITCGKWDPSATPAFDTSVSTADMDAVRAVVSGTPPSFLPFVEAPVITAMATALADQPVAALNIESTLAAIDSSKGALLNALVGGLLGGSVNLSAGAWNGLLNTDVNLLRYLDALALELGISAGNYDQVLGADVTLGQLLSVAADVLNQGGGSGGSTADVGAALGGLLQLANLNLPGFTPLLHLGDLINLQTGTPTSGLDLGLNLLQLVEGSVQLASSQCAVCATVPISLPGVAGINVRVKVIEPPQGPSIGNPALAVMDPLGPNRIYVRTAQVRTLISVDLPIAGSVLSGVQSLLNDTVISGITNTVNDLLSLNLLGLLQSLSCLVYCDIQRDIIDIQVLPSPRLDVNLDAGSGQAYVNDYDCSNTKSLSVPTKTAAAELRVGKMGDSAADAAGKVFSSSAPPTVEPVPLLDIGTRYVRYQCSLLLICGTTWRTASGTWTNDKSLSQRIAFAGGGIGVKADVPVAGSNTTLTYTDPPSGGLPNLGESPAVQTVTSTNIVNSLSNTLNGLQLQFYPPSGSSVGTSGLGNVLTLVGSVVNTLVSTLTGIISGVLSPLLDPLLNLLLTGLGVDLNKVDVGANMTCQGSGATLVD